MPRMQWTCSIGKEGASESGTLDLCVNFSAPISYFVVNSSDNSVTKTFFTTLKLSKFVDIFSVGLSWFCSEVVVVNDDKTLGDYLSVIEAFIFSLQKELGQSYFSRLLPKTPPGSPSSSTSVYSDATQNDSSSSASPPLELQCEAPRKRRLSKKRSRESDSAPLRVSIVDGKTPRFMICGRGKDRSVWLSCRLSVGEKDSSKLEELKGKMEQYIEDNKEALLTAKTDWEKKSNECKKMNDAFIRHLNTFGVEDFFKALKYRNPGKSRSFSDVGTDPSSRPRKLQRLRLESKDERVSSYPFAVNSGSGHAEPGAAPSRAE